MVFRSLLAAAAVALLTGCGVFSAAGPREVIIRTPMYVVPMPPPELQRPPITGTLPEFVVLKSAPGYVALNAENAERLKRLLEDLRRRVIAWPLWVNTLRANAEIAPPAESAGDPAGGSARKSAESATP